MIEIDVKNQRLFQCSSGLVSGSQEFVRFKFNLSADWDSLTTFAQFRQDGVAYNQYLDEENCVYLPAEIRAGYCTVMLYGTGGNTHATTNHLTLKIEQDILIPDAQSTVITKSLYDSLVDTVNVFTNRVKVLEVEGAHSPYINPDTLTWFEWDPDVGDYVDTRVSASGGNMRSYSDLTKVKDYLYDIHYENLDYQYAFKYYKDQANTANSFACSAVRNGSFVGRNYDWLYDNSSEFIVHVPRIAGRYSSHGIAGGLSALTDEFIDSGENSHLYKIIPFNMLDGENECGLYANINVVPSDYGRNVAVPTGESFVEINGLMLIRYLLDYFDNATDAVNFVKEHMTVYFPDKLYEKQYEVHYMVCDKDKTYCIEFVDNRTEIIDITDTPIITNFHRYGVTLNQDGTVYTPETQDDEHDALNTNGITEHGSGLERFNYAINNYSSSNTKVGMRNLMNGLKYTKAYITSEDPSDPFWYTEYVGEHHFVNTPVDEYTEVVAEYGTYFEDRSRDNPLTWQTLHSVVYDLENLKMYIIVQEGGEEVERTLEVHGYFDVCTQQEIIELLIETSILRDEDELRS